MTYIANQKIRLSVRIKIVRKRLVENAWRIRHLSNRIRNRQKPQASAVAVGST
jgi:hypothetical protein